MYQITRTEMVNVLGERFVIELETTLPSRQGTVESHASFHPFPAVRRLAELQQSRLRWLHLLDTLSADEQADNQQENEEEDDEEECDEAEEEEEEDDNEEDNEECHEREYDEEEEEEEEDKEPAKPKSVIKTNAFEDCRQLLAAPSASSLVGSPLVLSLTRICEELQGNHRPSDICTLLAGISRILEVGALNAPSTGYNPFALILQENGALDLIESLQMHENHAVYEAAMKVLQCFFNDEDEENTA